jgi:hypothetical protein
MAVVDWASVDWAAVLTGLSLGLALAATCGIRAFLPLFVVGCLGAMGHIEVSPAFTWMTGPLALTGLGTAVVLEVAGDKIPVVDHFLDAAAIVVKPIAAMIATASVMTELDPALTAVIGLVLGGSLAQGVHLVKAKLRLLSSALTATLANPFISIFEDLLALVATAVAFLVPVLVFVMAVCLSVWGFRLWWQRRDEVSKAP